MDRSDSLTDDEELFVAEQLDKLFPNLGDDTSTPDRKMAASIVDKLVGER